MDKYHVALSFAGEERSYVDEVARALRDSGVSVFYDKFEDTKLWGKDLYVYLRDIYQNKAVYTVIFVSEAYKISYGQITRDKARRLGPLQRLRNTSSLRCLMKPSKSQDCSAPLVTSI